MIDRQMQSQKTERADIAIVGIGCWYPGAHGPRELWENILACRRQFRQIPAERLGHAYFSPDVKTPDKTYRQRVAVIDGFKFDGSRFRIPQSTVASIDIAQWLALQVASETLEDARMMETVSCFGKTGVFVGNTLTGDQTRSSSMRLRWPYVRKSLEIAGGNGVFHGQIWTCSRRKWRTSTSRRSRPSMKIRLPADYQTPSPVGFVTILTFLAAGTPLMEPVRHFCWRSVRLLKRSH